LPVNPTRNKKGFTLVELLVAISLILIIATGMLPVFSHVARFNQVNKIRATANALAAGVMEEIAALEFEDVGTIDGNPSGNIPQSREVTVDDAIYTIETMITWVGAESAANPFGTGYVDTAYKNVRVTVSAYDPFSGETYNYEQMHTISAREGEMKLHDKGNIRAVVKSSDGQSIDDPPIRIRISGPETASMKTNFAGEVLFGELEPGIYEVEAEIPPGMAAASGQAVSASKIKASAEVQKWITTDVYFYMDKPESFSTISIKFIDEETGEVIKPTGTLTLNWTHEGIIYEKYVEKTITTSDYAGDGLPGKFIGNLWPAGSYELVLAGLRTSSKSYKEYSVRLQDDTQWNGEFSEAGENLALTVVARGIERKVLIKEDLYSEFDDNRRFEYSVQNIFMNDDGGDGSIILERRSNLEPNRYTITGSQYISGSYPASNAFNTSSNSYALFNSNREGYINFELDNPVTPAGLRIQLHQSSYRPDVIRLYGIREDGAKDLLLQETRFTQYNDFSIETESKYRAYQLMVITGSSNARVYNVRLYYEGYVSPGTRYLRIPIGDLDISDKKKAPIFTVNWSIDTPDGTDVEFYASSSLLGSQPNQSTFKRIYDEDDIRGIVKEGTQISQTSYLWIKQVLTSSDPGKTPVLDSFLIMYEE